MSQSNQDYRSVNPENLSWSEELAVNASKQTFNKPLFLIEYPELDEDGYITSPNVITTGQLRLDQAISRKKAFKCERFDSWGERVAAENKNRASVVGPLRFRSKLTEEQKYTKDWINND